MIATIKAEWRKSRLRPGFLIGAAVIAGITILVYAANWYLALHPLATRGGDRAIQIDHRRLRPGRWPTRSAEHSGIRGRTLKPWSAPISGPSNPR